MENFNKQEIIPPSGFSVFKETVGGKEYYALERNPSLPYRRKYCLYFEEKELISSLTKLAKRIKALMDFYDEDELRLELNSLDEDERDHLRRLLSTP